MSEPAIEVIAGNTAGIWEIGHDVSEAGDGSELAELDEDYACFVAVDGTEIAREVTAKTDDGTRFRVWLTPDETADLTPRQMYVVGIELRNPSLSPPLVLETQRRIRIKAGVVAG